MTQMILMVLVTLALLLCWFISSRERERGFQKERDAWAVERKDLMDRIQAPSFAEYANKVVREKKAEQPVEEEKPVEFVS